ncbi:hypothetical protein [Microbulbifer variabilis]|uniref:hypothetical protein n=1 Tax=Microbulbifer variabilis TaxID=266805 RepID=UPI001CFE8954|nr:hypothetical protein [Microbulbifer variabilis]
MKKTAKVLGITLLTLSFFGLSAFLPLDIWGYVVGLFVEPEPGTYYKVVFTDSAEISTGLMFVIGLALVVWGFKKS